MDNLIELIGKQLTPDVISAASGLTGESNAAVGSALSAIAPTLLGGLVSQGSSRSGASTIMEMIAGQNNSDDVVGGFANMLGNQGSSSMLMNAGLPMLKSLFGHKYDGVIDLIASVSGIKKGSASSLLSLAAPLVMGMLGKQVKSQGLDAGGLMNLLGGQRQYLDAAAPAGLGNLLGVSNFADMKMPDINVPKVDVPKVSARMPEAPRVNVPEVAKPSGSIWRWLLPLLAVLLVGWLLYTFFLPAGNAAVDAVQDGATTVVGAAQEGTAAVCESLGSFGTAVEGLPAVTADTEVSTFKDGYTKVRAAYDKIAELAKAAGIANLDGLTNALDAVDKLLDGITGTTIGDAAEALTGAMSTVTEASDSITATVGCK